MNREEFMTKCAICRNCGERYFYGTTAQYCGYYEEFCSDIYRAKKGEEENCQQFIEEEEIEE